MRYLAITASVVTAALLLVVTAYAKPGPRVHVEHVRTIGYGQVKFDGRGPEHWHLLWQRQRRLVRSLRAQQQRRWQPTVTYALRLASAVSGVSYWDLRSVAQCESGLYPFARNGRYLGLFQMHWQPFGFSPFDPIANALSAALTVRHDGGWRQWECQP